MLPVSTCTIGMGVCSNCHNHYLDYLACGVKGLVAGKAKTAGHPKKNRRTQEISSILKDLKDAGTMAPAYLISFMSLAPAGATRSRTMTVDRCRPSQK